MRISYAHMVCKNNFGSLIACRKEATQKHLKGKERISKNPAIQTFRHLNEGWANFGSNRSTRDMVTGFVGTLAGLAIFENLVPWQDRDNRPLLRLKHGPPGSDDAN